MYVYGSIEYSFSTVAMLDIMQMGAVLVQKIWGAFPHQLLHHQVRVHFICSPKPTKIRTPYRPTFEIY